MDDFYFPSILGSIVFVMLAWMLFSFLGYKRLDKVDTNNFDQYELKKFESGKFDFALGFFLSIILALCFSVFAVVNYNIYNAPVNSSASFSQFERNKNWIHNEVRILKSSSLDQRFINEYSLKLLELVDKYSCDYVTAASNNKLSLYQDELLNERFDRNGADLIGIINAENTKFKLSKMKAELSDCNKQTAF